MVAVLETQQFTVDQLEDLILRVMAAELYLTYFATQRGKQRARYQEALDDFAMAWTHLKNRRDPAEFHSDPSASSALSPLSNVIFITNYLHQL